MAPLSATLRAAFPLAAVIYTLGSACILAGLFFWQGDAYSTYAEGVYLFSSRLVLDGAVPYKDFITAHPPLLVYSGAGLLAISDTAAADTPRCP